MTFTAQIANFIAYGDINTELEKGGWIKNVIEFSIDKYECRLVVYPDVLEMKRENPNNLKGFFIESSDLFIKGITSQDEGEQVVTDICKLLSLATMSRVVWHSYSYKEHGRSMTVSGFYNNFRPLLEYEATNQIKDFLECCWQPYQQNKEKRKLSAVIEYLLQCDKPGQPLEARILFISIVLESLKSTYAHENGYKFDGTGFLTDVQQDKKLKCKDDTKCKNRYMSFRNLLEKMLAEVGIQVELTDIIFYNYLLIVRHLTDNHF